MNRPLMFIDLNHRTNHNIHTYTNNTSVRFLQIIQTNIYTCNTHFEEMLVQVFYVQSRI